MISLFSAVAPVALIILIGYLAGKTFDWERQTLAQLSVYILAPALVADSLYHTTLSLSSTLGLLGGFTLFTFIFAGIGVLISRFLGLSAPVQKSLMATTLLPNNGNMGLPVVAFALGDEGLERAVVCMIGSSILLFGLMPAILQGNGLIYGIRLTLRLPLIWAMLGGLGLKLLAVELPLGLDKGLTELGRAAIPTALILLGLELASTQFKLGRFEVLASSLRLGLSPFIALAAGYLLQLKGLDLQVLILQCAMPTAINSLILVTEFGGDATKVARTIVVTTLLSFLTLPLVIWAFS